MVLKSLTPLLLSTLVALSGCALINPPSDTASPAPPDTGTSDNSPEPQAAAQNVLVGSDGVSQITLPDGWVEDRELHDSAEIQASKRADEMYVIVLSENKADFQDLTLEQHSEITRGLLLQSLTDAEVTGPTAVTSVQGNPTLQYQIRGAIDGINVVYLHTTVETPDSYHQILAWTLPSQFEANDPQLQEIIQSFREAQN